MTISLQFDSVRQYLGAMTKMNVQEISRLTGCLQACSRTEFKSKVSGEFVRYHDTSKSKLPVVSKKLRHGGMLFQWR